MPQNKTNTRKRTTLRSLAAQLDIHVSTVSRVLNGTEAEARSAASPEMITRIKQLAKQLNYRPNRQAIGLKTSKTRLIGVILPRLTRSEEHTSELQSLMRISYAVFCLKKKKT